MNFSRVPFAFKIFFFNFLFLLLFLIIFGISVFFKNKYYYNKRLETALPHSQIQPASCSVAGTSSENFIFH